MNKKAIIFVIILTSISLTGIVFTQLFWVKNALKLKEEQFSHRVSIALKSTVNQLLDYKDDTTSTVFLSKNNSGNETINDNIITSINPESLDSIIKEEFLNMKIQTEFEYGIFRKSDNHFVVGKYNSDIKNIINSNHFTTLSSLWKPDRFILSVYFPKESNFLIRQMIGWLSISAVFILIIIFIFSYIILSLVKQKKLSEMKTDFVNNMTHEFKTPIATISLASEMLLKPGVNEMPQKTKKYASIIYDENSRLKNQVEQVLQIAVLDKGNFKLRKKEINLHKLIEFATENFEMQIKQRSGKITTNLGASMATLYADPDHITNIINNLMDNANKYTTETPEIIISTRNSEKGIIMTVKDNGIGISNENQKHIFKKFFRVHTGNIHDVKGFGLGLYYVKTIVEAHGGSATLQSELKKGTQFEIYFPYV